LKIKGKTDILPNIISQHQNAFIVSFQIDSLQTMLLLSLKLFTLLIKLTKSRKDMLGSSWTWQKHV